MKSTWVKTVSVDKKNNEWVVKWVKVRDWGHKKMILGQFFSAEFVPFYFFFGVFFWFVLTMEAPQ